MLTFSEILPVSPETGHEKFFETVSGLFGVELDGSMNEDISNDNLSMTIRTDSENESIGSRCVYKDANVTVQYDITYSVRDSIMVVKEYKTISEGTGIFIDSGEEVPDLVKKIEKSGIIATDIGIKMTDTPHIIEHRQIPLMHEVLNDVRPCSIPLIYLSRTEDGLIPVDYTRLASVLSGIANVVYESKDLMTHHEVINNGIIGICLPDGSKAMITPLEFVNPDRFFKKIHHLVFHWHLIRKTPPELSFDSILMNSEIGLINEQSVNKHDYETALRRVKDLSEKNMQLNGRVESLEYELKTLRESLNQSDNRPVICFGKEKDMFNGEIKDFVLMAVESMLNNCVDGTRRYDVLKDILESNDFQHIHDERREIIKQALKGYNYASTGSLQQTFNSLGISIERDGKHYKMTPYGNEKYKTVLAGTPSDVRAGKNMAGIINNLLN